MQLTELLEQKRVNFQISAHRPTFTAQQMAAEEHVSGMNVAKPVVVQADGKYYMCVLPACCKIDLDLLRCQLGAGAVELASEKEMANLFPDCELGAEPPLGNLYGITTIMDKSLADDEYLLFQAGKHNQAVRVKRTDYEQLVQPRILEFTYHLH